MRMVKIRRFADDDARRVKNDLPNLAGWRSDGPVS